MAKFGYTKGQVVKVDLPGHSAHGKSGEVNGFTASRVYVQLEDRTVLMSPDNLEGFYEQASDIPLQ